MTGIGVILGTAAYMSPEQARGRPVDKRTDVWAFGAVLYEMLTGARAFDGEDVTEMMAAVVKSTPNWAALPADVPPHVVTLIQRCLEKDRNARIGDIAVARFLLSDHAIGRHRIRSNDTRRERTRCDIRRSLARAALARRDPVGRGGCVDQRFDFGLDPIARDHERHARHPTADERKSRRAASRFDKRSFQTRTYGDGVVA